MRGITTIVWSSRLFCLLLLLYAFFPFNAGSAESRAVYVLPVEGTIDAGTLLFMQRAVEEITAEEGAIILVFDTPGGYLDTALDVRSLIQETPLPVYSLVKPRALSAGAYLALSADALYMVPGSTIGAAEPRLVGSAEPADEKTLSFWEAEMRSAAEQQGKDPKVAAAMVRSALEIPGVVDQDKLLTLTASEAVSLEFADGLISHPAELQEQLGMSEYPLVELSPTRGEQLSGWLTSPVVATLLLTIALAAMVLEVLTSGFGLPGIISVAAFGLYFGGHLMAGTAGYESLILFTIGIVLMLVEAFVPGFGVFGAGGLVAVVVAIVLAAATMQQGIIMFFVAVVLAAIIIYISLRFLKRRGILDRIVLSDTEGKELGYVAPRNLTFLEGKQGFTLTPLRPSGSAEIDGKRVDVVSEGGFLSSGEEVVVSRVEGVRVIVRQKNKGEKEGGR